MIRIRQFILVLGISTGISACFHTSRPQTQTNQLHILVDTTDPATVLPDSMIVLTYFDVHTQRNNGAQLTITTITDKGLNPSVELALPDIASSVIANKSDDIHARDKEIRSFYSTVLSHLVKINQAGRTKTYAVHSECFETLCKQLSSLKANSLVGKKELWLFSDMLEHSKLFDAYHESLSTEKQRHALMEKMESTNLLPPDLSGITIRFYYNPKSRLDDERYKNIMLVYKAVLEKRLATVSIRANN